VVAPLKAVRVISVEVAPEYDSVKELVTGSRPNLIVFVGAIAVRLVNLITCLDRELLLELESVSLVLLRFDALACATNSGAPVAHNKTAMISTSDICAVVLFIR
jgi:hypothetical protein